MLQGNITCLITLKHLRDEKIINNTVILVLFSFYFVKKPRQRSALPTFFALSKKKIISHNCQFINSSSLSDNSLSISFSFLDKGIVILHYDLSGNYLSVHRHLIKMLKKVAESSYKRIAKSNKTLELSMIKKRGIHYNIYTLISYIRGISLILVSVVLLSLSFPLDASAQEYLPKVKYYNVSEGLSHRDVYCIHQDSRGFIWIGTQYGLGRFDGTDFQWFTKKNGLYDNTINDIQEDEDGNLWLFYKQLWTKNSSSNHIALFNIYSNKAISFDEKFKGQFKAKDIKGYFFDKERHVSFAVGDRIINYSSKEGISSIQGLDNYYLLSKTSKGTFWMTNDEGNLCEIDSTGQQKIVLSEKGPISYSFIREDETNNANYFFGLQSDTHHCVYLNVRVYNVFAKIWRIVLVIEKTG